MSLPNTTPLCLTCQSMRLRKAVQACAQTEACSALMTAPSEKVSLWGLVQEEVYFLQLLCHPFKVSCCWGGVHGNLRPIQRNQQEPANSLRNRLAFPEGHAGGGTAQGGLLRSAGTPAQHQVLRPSRQPVRWEGSPGRSYPRPPGAAGRSPSRLCKPFCAALAGRPPGGTLLIPCGCARWVPSRGVPANHLRQLLRIAPSGGEVAVGPV